MNQSDAGQQRTFIAPETYYAQLAAVHVATGALITDPADRVLLVKPFSRPHWLLPGGMAYEGEPPEVACARTGRGTGAACRGGAAARGRLGAAVRPPDAAPAVSAVRRGHRGRAGFRLQDAELDDAGFFEPGEAAARLAAGVAARVPVALAARERGITVYRPAGG
ncbi:NUDIX hydrolase [Nonomuraea sp. NPDC050202]|uniref:NUDIX hydrolase n=1 Tax=Nonomuraea sp. NPDC050202 TaxID=3155035 RepID=UPI00340B19FA